MSSRRDLARIRGELFFLGMTMRDRPMHKHWGMIASRKQSSDMRAARGCRRFDKPFRE
jgi:hypothetical protein